MKLEDVINRLIEKIENSSGKWIKPFNNSMPTNYATKTEYVGINIFNLWAEAEDKNYSMNNWATFNQIKSLNGAIKKGEKGTNVFFFKPLKIKKEDDQGEEIEKTIPMLKTYLVWNIDQTTLSAEEIQNTKIENLEEFFLNQDVEIKTSNTGAYYSPSEDYINMPHMSTFISSEFYYATLLHELAHSTGHQKKLNRDFSGKINGSEEKIISYAKEELIAETTRSFLQVKLNLDTTEMEAQNALYLKSWIKPLKENPRILWSIFSEASRAYNYILEYTNQKKEVA